MNTVERPLRIVVPGDAPEDVWLAARAAGVTASEMHAIAQGGRGTWKRILVDKLNGSTFRGNRHTRRGHEREPFLIEWAAAQPQFGAIRPNRALYGHHSMPLHLATPDGLGWNATIGGFGIEAKSHDHGWSPRRGIPVDHLDQMQGGMHVTGFDAWLYVWEVMGEDGEPTLADPQHMWVSRDQARIDRLVAEADRFIAWREAGAPDTDDIPGEVDDALAAWRDARDRKNAALADEKAATTIIRAFAEGSAGDAGAKAAGSRAHFTFSVTETSELDELAWESAEPGTYAEWCRMRTAVEEYAQTATALYSRPSRSTRLNIYANKEN